GGSGGGQGGEVFGHRAQTSPPNPSPKRRGGETQSEPPIVPSTASRRTARRAACVRRLGKALNWSLGCQGASDRFGQAGMGRRDRQSAGGLLSARGRPGEASP